MASSNVLTRNQNLSHIQTGYMYNSPAKNLVRVDETFEDGLATSVFNFANVTDDGRVDNTLTSVFKDFAHPQVWRGYVNTNYPLIGADFLAKAGAVFSGLVERDFMPGRVASVCFRSHSSFYAVTDGFPVASGALCTKALFRSRCTWMGVMLCRVMITLLPLRELG